MPLLQSLAPPIVTVGVMTIIPIIQFGVIYPLVYPKTDFVDYSSCSCHCWDTVFRGEYESYPGGYHHVYFNSNKVTAFMWFITLAYVVAALEVFRYLLSIRENLLRRYLVLFILSIYSHHYAFWSFWGYLNDSFYWQLAHQAIFTATELAASSFVLYLSDSSKQRHRLYALTFLFAVNAAHLTIGARDQFWAQLVAGTGHMSQRTRNFGFVIPDFLSCCLAAYDMAGILDRFDIPLLQFLTAGECLHALLSYLVVTAVGLVIL